MCSSFMTKATLEEYFANSFYFVIFLNSNVSNLNIEAKLKFEKRAGALPFVVDIVL